MENENKTAKILKNILNAPPVWVNNAFILQNISNLPMGIQVFELIKLGVANPSDIFDSNNPTHMTLFSFLSKQYSYMHDLLVLADLYDRKGESVFYRLPTSSLWSIGAIASAMFDNLLCFAWIADNFKYKANLFCDFYSVQDLDLYPTNVVLPDGTRIDDSILDKCKRVAEKYKRKNVNFNSNSDYTNRNLYINEWYNNEKSNLKKLAEDITLKLDFVNIDIDWTQVYKDYVYLCDFKHMSPQKVMVFGNYGEQVNAIARVFKMGIKAFVLTNKALIKIHEDNNFAKDDLLLNIENQLSEFAKLTIEVEKNKQPS